MTRKYEIPLFSSYLWFLKDKSARPLYSGARSIDLIVGEGLEHAKKQATTGKVVLLTDLETIKNQ